MMKLLHKHSGGFWRKLIGWACVGTGLLGILLPIIPGIPFLVAGLVSLSAEHRWIRALLIPAKRKLAKVRPQISRMLRLPRRNSRVLRRQAKESS
jgi:Putative transmembrane protein (PGPGW)